jgi:hypothetical protein
MSGSSGLQWRGRRSAQAVERPRNQLRPARRLAHRAHHILGVAEAIARGGLDAVVDEIAPLRHRGVR